MRQGTRESAPKTEGCLRTFPDCLRYGSKNTEIGPRYFSTADFIAVWILLRAVRKQPYRLRLMLQYSYMGSGVFKAIAAGFLCGVFIRSFAAAGFSFVLYLLLLSIALLALIRADRKHARLLICGALSFAACAGGIMRMDAATLTGDSNLTARIGSAVTLIGTVSAEPDVRDTQTRIDIDATQLVEGSTTLPVASGVLVELPPHAQVRYGDMVRISGTLGLPQPFDAGESGSFDYPDYLAVSGIAYELSFAHGSSTGENHGNPLLTAVIAIKERYEQGLGAVLPEPEAGLAAGITVGDKRSIGPQLSADFQKVGLLQMVVLSGYNITVVTDFVARLLLWANRPVQFSAGIFIAIFFVVISGGGSSAIRAAIMAVIAMYARMSGRSFDPVRALLASALVMVAWNPFVLAFDPGFQLSAIAMLGLSTLTPLIDPYMQWVSARFGLREIVSSTIATQVAVTPLLLHQDGTLSLLSLPANMFSMMPVPLAMLCSFIAAVSGAFVGSLATPLAFPAYVLLWYIVNVGHTLASLPIATITAGAISGPLTMATYCCLFAFVAFIKAKGDQEDS